MRCKVGDLCFIIKSKSFPENQGRLVRIVGTTRVPFGFWRCLADSPLSVRCRKTHKPKLGIRIVKHDSALMPIRAQEGEDEMLRLVGLPQQRASLTS